MSFSLKRYRVIDFGTAMAAPVLTRMLADMGAEVIKVESREKMDGVRMGRPIIGDDIAGGDKGAWPNLQPAFHNYNRNKKGITLNFKHPKGFNLLKDLIGISDIVCNNFRPGLMEEIGLGYPELVKIKPDIIDISLTGLGEYGPWSRLPTYAHSIAALGGLNSLVGYRNELVGTMANAFGDSNASIHGALAVLAALYYRNRTGKGQHIDLSEAQACTSLLGEAIMDYIMNDRTPGPEGNDYPVFAPRNNYRCEGEDKWVSIAVKTEAEWRNFCSAIGNPTWVKEKKFSDKYGRWENREELDKGITSWTENQSPYEVMEKLQKAGVASAPVMNIEDEYFDPHFKERQTFVEFEHPLVGFEAIYGIPWKMSKTPGQIYRHAPSLGEDNDYVFGRLLGLNKDDIVELKAEKVIY
ncbi:CaiB/BaiF CoA transferase family protein [Thermodesulfobacteriota bacterium]